MLDGLDSLASQAEGDAEVLAGVGVIRVQAKGFLEFTNRLGGLAFHAEDVAEVIVGEGETVPSVVSIWPTANWLEREVYDMFGVVYDGHPDLKRILLPDGWTGHPLRKDYDILKQDDAWVKANLGIESGQ